MPRKYKHQNTLNASLAVNYLLFLAMAIYTVAAITKQYADYPQPTVLDSNTTHRTIPAHERKEVAASDATGRNSVNDTGPTRGRAVGDVPQEIKDALAETCRYSYKKYQAEIIGYGLSEGVYLSTCYADLNGLAHAESRHNPNAHGDIGIGSGSYGIVQINQHFHPGTKDCALDVSCSTRYAIDRLHRFGYPKYRTRAIQCWNGCTAQNGYAEAVKKFAEMYL